ncbi:MAG: fructose-1,6-bisphosphate aldolase/phosphatase [Bacillota bacterium]
MKTTLSVIKADIGSIAGHIRPSQALVDSVKDCIESELGNLITDYYIGSTGDDVAILFAHQHGAGCQELHQLAWNAFICGTEKAKEQGLYGAGQDLLADAFSGNVKGLGPAVAEMEIEERKAEPFLLFTADKTDPGAYNLPLYLSFTDPMHCSGLILSSEIKQGFKFVILDVGHTKEDRIIELYTPEDTYDIAALLRDNERFVVQAIYSRATGAQATVASTTRLHNIAGTYTGKDDPVMLVRCQGDFPATGEILSPYSIGHYVAGFMRGSHTGPLMPAKMGCSISYFDGPPVVSAVGFCVHNGKFTEPVDCFDHPYWDYVRNKVSQKAVYMREQGFSGPAMLHYSELEYGGIVDILNTLDDKFSC